MYTKTRGTARAPFRWRYPVSFLPARGLPLPRAESLGESEGSLTLLPAKCTLVYPVMLYSLRLAGPAGDFGGARPQPRKGRCLA